MRDKAKVFLHFRYIFKKKELLQATWLFKGDLFNVQKYTLRRLNRKPVKLMAGNFIYIINGTFRFIVLNRFKKMFLIQRHFTILVALLSGSVQTIVIRDPPHPALNYRHRLAISSVPVTVILLCMIFRLAECYCKKW